MRCVAARLSARSAAVGCRSASSRAAGVGGKSRADANGKSWADVDGTSWAVVDDGKSWAVDDGKSWAVDDGESWADVARGGSVGPVPSCVEQTRVLRG